MNDILVKGFVDDENLTQYQSDGEQSRSQKLSMEATTPPAEVPGYRLQKFLGAGAFGQVWVGRDLNTGRSVAVKFFLHRSGVNWSLLSREVKNLVQMSADRHVVQVLEVGWESDPPYYVMELVTGGSLEEFLQTRGAIPASEAVELFRKICVGLNHCHGKGVLHCDLKPANILMGEDQEPRLADFGQSRMSHDQTPTLGTLFYMAPEQADLESAPNAGWDVYAVGAILYRMLTGVAPYRDKTVMDQIDTAGSLPKRLARYREAIKSSPPPTDHLKKAGVDRSLVKIVNRCLAVNADDRYQNVQQILQDLSRRETARQRRPLMLLGLVGPLLLLVASSLYAVHTIDRATELQQRDLRNSAFSGNLLAAKLSARNLESEISRYFQLARDESQRGEFVTQLKNTLEDKTLTPLREELAAAGTSLAAEKKTDVRERLLDSESRIALDKILHDRLMRYRGSTDGKRLRLATMFVTDRYGTIISIAYDPPVERDRNSAGRNYAYRTYYHGGQQDLDRHIPIKDIKPFPGTQPHMSAPFTSSATDLWKVAISLPIYLTEDHSRPDAVFVATINLGDFQLLQSEEGTDQVVVLVDARDGESRGTVLQHPLLESRDASGRKLAPVGKVPPELMSELFTGKDVDYQDPVSKAADGKGYAGDWIAAMQPVVLPQDVMDDESDTAATEADLLVLVQYRLSKALQPVQQMRSSLLWEGAVALASILAILMTLWYFVRRTSDSNSTSSSPSTGLMPNRLLSSGTTETLPAEDA